MKKGGCVYIMTNKNNTVLYTGVTSDLIKRCYQHKTSFYPGSFTSKYQTFKLVYYESFISIEAAIIREKQIKSGSRKKKLELINQINPTWTDLYESLFEA
ncbi:MAG: GIY-YIG nuclease family protein [Bacteroidetes bacterium]|nr:GIY-YIG nuclease family protein [Bacteroidota bacterium]